MNKKIVTLSALILAALLILPLDIWAAFPELGKGAVIVPTVFFDKIFNFIWPFFLGFAIIMFIVAGFIFLTASGEAGKVKTAKDAVLWGIIGIIVAILSFSIPGIIGTLLG